MQETQPYVVPPEAPIDVPIGALAEQLKSVSSPPEPEPESEPATTE